MYHTPSGIYNFIIPYYINYYVMSSTEMFTDFFLLLFKILHSRILRLQWVT